MSETTRIPPSSGAARLAGERPAGVGGAAGDGGHPAALLAQVIRIMTGYGAFQALREIWIAGFCQCILLPNAR